MLRTVLTPRWLGGLVLVLLAMAACVVLGLWQLSVARDRGLADAVLAAPTRPVAPVTEVLAPHGQFPEDGTGRRVSATGSYDASGQVLVVDRRLDGAVGAWVVTPLVVDGSGARLAFVRGFVPDGEPAPAPPTGTVAVTGALAPGESPADLTSPLPEGRLGTLDLSVLVNRWPGEIYNAFAFAISEDPDPLAADAALQRFPPPEPSGGGLDLRNAAYAVQWWIFAAFAAYMWWRMVREETARRRAPDGDPPDVPAQPTEVTTRA